MTILMIKKLFKKIRIHTPSWVWAILALYSGIMAVLGMCVTVKLGGVHIIAAYSWVTGGFVDNEALAIAILAGLFSATFTYFARASFLFYKETINSSQQGR